MRTDVRQEYKSHLERADNGDNSYEKWGASSAGNAEVKTTKKKVYVDITKVNGSDWHNKNKTYEIHATENTSNSDDVKVTARLIGEFKANILMNGSKANEKNKRKDSEKYDRRKKRRKKVRGFII